MGKAFMGNRVGEINTATNGQKMTIVTYRTGRDLDVEFEDGTLVQHKCYTAFQDGKIKNPNLYGSAHIGETGIAKNGMQMRIIACRSHDDMDIEFEDGTRVYHKTYQSFKQGYIKNPNIAYTCNIQRTKNASDRYVGKIGIAKNGLKMTIIAYRGWDDIDIEFEDGIVVTNKSYQNFQRGSVKHPDYNMFRLSQHIKDRTGETKLGKNGLVATICEYTNYYTIRVKFDTGHISDPIQYQQFLRGDIKHPFPYNLGMVSIEKPAYIYNDVGNFFCRCNKCHKADILTIQEIREHRCEV